MKVGIEPTTPAFSEPCYYRLSYFTIHLSYPAEKQKPFSDRSGKGLICSRCVVVRSEQTPPGAAIQQRIAAHGKETY